MGLRWEGFVKEVGLSRDTWKSEGVMDNESGKFCGESVGRSEAEMDRP